MIGRKHMRIRRTELRGTFVAKDAKSISHLVHTFVSIVNAAPDSDEEIEGFYTYQMEDGREVRRHRKGQYQIWGSGEILTSDTSDAP
jgi:hypothetical protein